MHPLGLALSMLNRVASSDALDRLGARAPAQQLVRRATRAGFSAAAAVGERFKGASPRKQPERLERPAASKRFDLNYTEDQEMIRGTAERFAAEQLRPNAAAADAACRAPAEVTEQLAELGLSLYAIPEALGGAGTERSPVTGALLAETLARGDMGLAVAALAPLGVATALVKWGSAAQQARYLPAFVEGKTPASSIAVNEPRPLFDPSSLRTRARLTPGGFVLDGVKTLVPLAEEAELLLVSADLLGKGPQLFVVERGTPGVTVTADPGMGVRAASLGRVQLDGVRLDAGAILGGELGACDHQELIDLSRIAWCALAVGTAQAVLDYVVPYCNDRHAFGEPISNRQSVAFLIANLAIEIDAMRLLTLRAASRAEHGLPFHREAYLARVLCAEKAMEIGTNGVQLLGGHGYVKEHPVERWYRDLRVVGIAEGGLVV
jgi:alkylation response protein AidB-like acyl-CoA dehydrogenase